MIYLSTAIGLTPGSSK